MPERPSALAPFRLPTYRSLWLASIVSNFGGLVQAVGAGWMMTELTHSPGMVALVQASTTLPIMLFSLPSGALADSLNRRRIMLTAQVFMLAASAGLALAAFAGLLTPWLLLTFTFLIGVGVALHNPSWQASVGDIVPRADLPSAVALNSMGFNLMRSVGPALGGLIVAAGGAAAAFAINAASYIPLCLALFLWRPDYAPRRLPREALGSAVAAGLRYVSMSPVLLKVLFRGFLFGLAAVSLLALLPIVARDLVGGGAFTYGVLLGCFGFGAIGGALLGARLRERFRNETIVRGGFLGFAAALVALSLSRDLWLSGLVLLPAGASWVLSLSLFNVSVQLATPRWVVGRALALYQTATFGGMAAGSLLWGQAAEAGGVAQALAWAAGVLLVGALVGLRIPLPAFGMQDLDPLNRFVEPDLPVDLRLRSGPIVVTVEYDIAPANIEPFLAAMADRRRIRIRDGARQWVLLRDLERPGIWAESYHVATWADYLRHHERRTKADAEVTDRLLALHEGPGKPRVRRMIERQTVPLHDDLPLKPEELA
ncbi:MFS transporter [Cereibacter sphaeroides]|uniref:MFS transporter n=1 Tax=Rhodobacterales TaxID=204455 RepID=UPI000BBE30C3|nr:MULTISPECIES: MFS transporter [Paracoccaceae]MCE6960009.1 MFS transporter [Cereibacter sphaeroides]MCE6973094.1 MFS transporter [Cereibacter sphaeroides]